MTAEYVPTADQRALVENAAAFGITQAAIAEHLKIAEKTLRTSAPHRSAKGRARDKREVKCLRSWITHRGQATWKPDIVTDERRPCSRTPTLQRKEIKQAWQELPAAPREPQGPCIYLV